jgi:hypothetical protein
VWTTHFAQRSGAVQTGLSFAFDFVVSDFLHAGVAELADALDSKASVCPRKIFRPSHCYERLRTKTTSLDARKVNIVSTASHVRDYPEQTNPHAPDTTNRQIPTHTIAQASSISAASNQHRWSMRREKDVQDTRR